MTSRSSARIRPLPRRLDSLSGTTSSAPKAPGVKPPPKKLLECAPSDSMQVKEETKSGGSNVRDILARSTQVEKKIEPPRGRSTRLQVIRDDVCQEEMRLAHHVPVAEEKITGISFNATGICPPMRLTKATASTVHREDGKSLMMIQMPRHLPPLPGKSSLAPFSEIADGRIGTFRQHASGKRSLLIGDVVFDISESERNDSSKTEFVCICPTDGEAIFLGHESTGRLVVCPVIA